MKKEHSQYVKGINPLQVMKNHKSDFCHAKKLCFFSTMDVSGLSFNKEF